MGAKGVRRAGPIVRMDMRRRRICRVPRFFAWRGAFFPVRGKNLIGADFYVRTRIDAPDFIPLGLYGEAGSGEPPGALPEGKRFVGGRREPHAARATGRHRKSVAAFAWRYPAGGAFSAPGGERGR